MVWIYWVSQWKLTHFKKLTKNWNFHYLLSKFGNYVPNACTMQSLKLKNNICILRIWPTIKFKHGKIIILSYNLVWTPLHNNQRYCLNYTNISIKVFEIQANKLGIHFHRWTLRELSKFQNFFLIVKPNLTIFSHSRKSWNCWKSPSGAHSRHFYQFHDFDAVRKVALRLNRARYEKKNT